MPSLLSLRVRYMTGVNNNRMENRVRELQELTKQQFERLKRDFPDLGRRGLTLFLGHSYAPMNPRIMMLGINPGGDGDHVEDYDLQCSNCLLGDPQDSYAKVFHYWRNARRCFGSTSGLSTVMEYATFSFCSPFRTPRWSQTPQRQREAIELLSRPILQQMIADCRPTAVIVAGRIAVPLFCRVSAVSLTGESTPAG